MSVEIAVASHRALAPYVESGKRIHLPRIWNADDHAKLLLCVGVRSSRLHAAKFERRPPVFVEIGQDGGGLDSLGGEAKRLHAAHRAGRLRDRAAVFRHQRTCDAVKGSYARNVMLDNGNAGRTSRLDVLVQFIDCRLFEMKRLILDVWLVCHCITLLVWVFT